MFGNLAEIKETLEKMKSLFDDKEVVFLLTSTDTYNGNLHIVDFTREMEQADNHIGLDPVNNLALLAIRKKQ